MRGNIEKSIFCRNPAVSLPPCSFMWTVIEHGRTRLTYWYPIFKERKVLFYISIFHVARNVSIRSFFLRSNVLEKKFQVTTKLVWHALSGTQTHEWNLYISSLFGFLCFQDLSYKWQHSWTRLIHIEKGKFQEFPLQESSYGICVLRSIH